MGNDADAGAEQGDEHERHRPGLELGHEHGLQYSFHKDGDRRRDDACGRLAGCDQRRSLNG